MTNNANDDLIAFTVDDVSFKFPKTMFIKNPMTPVEQKNWEAALMNLRDGLIDADTLRLIAADPSRYNPMGLEIVSTSEMASMMDLIEVQSCLDLDRPHLHYADGFHPSGAELLKRQSEFIDNSTIYTAYGEEAIAKALKHYDSLGYDVGTLGSTILLSGVTHVQFDHSKMVKKKSDVINHPSHYTQYKGVEVIDITEKLNFNRGNAVKYIARAGFKAEGTEIQDLEKALWYVERQIAFGEDGSLALLTFDEVEKLVQQMNFHRGNAVWLICLAGQIGGKGTVVNDLTEATHSIRREIKRLKEYA
jgi:hypothetical protein